MDKVIEQAAQALADCMDYPWEHMPTQGRQTMRDNASKIISAALLAERERIAALIAQHSGLTLETLEYLETMRQGPSPEEWAELDRAARA